MTAPLCLIGMSGVGKSHWSRGLAALGFSRHDCDGAIARRLAEIVTPEPGEEPVHALGRWMGMPWSPGYAGREARYLALEEEETRKALSASLGPGRHVLDTTGSVIYLSAGLLSDLGARSRVVYLRTPESGRQKMLERYLVEPKPVVWGGAFSPRPGERPEEALPRCFAELLALRDARYQALAHVVLDGGELEARAPSVEAFLARCGAGGASGSKPPAGSW